MRFRERWGLRFHLWMCGNCKRFERQIDLVRRLLRQAARHGETGIAETDLPTEARERISAALAAQQCRGNQPSV